MAKSINHIFLENAKNLKTLGTILEVVYNFSVYFIDSLCLSEVLVGGCFHHTSLRGISSLLFCSGACNKYSKSCSDLYSNSG